MAATLGRVCKSGLLKPNYGPLLNQAGNLSTMRVLTRGKKVLVACLGVAAGTLGTFIYALDSSVKADSDILAKPQSYQWSWLGPQSTLDHASMRRGWEVYKNVCAACHSLKFMAYRHLINQTHTEDEVKALAEEIQVQDGPNDIGEYYMRPGKVFDTIPSPYPNEEAARAANNGSAPPDLTYVMNARHNGPNYVFSLLTGYCDPPAGIQIREGQYFNPYFAGGAIGMGQVIYDEVLEFEDGTPATASQVAKDVTTFLMWTANQDHDARKKLVIKSVVAFTVLTAAAFYMKKHKWSTVKSTKLLFIPSKK